MYDDLIAMQSDPHDNIVIATCIYGQGWQEVMTFDPSLAS